MPETSIHFANISFVLHLMQHIQIYIKIVIFLMLNIFMHFKHKSRKLYCNKGRTGGERALSLTTATEKETKRKKEEGKRRI